MTRLCRNPASATIPPIVSRALLADDCPLWQSRLYCTRCICNETKALDGYMDELKPKFKSTPTQFQTVIFASSDTPNVGDHDGDMSKTKLTERQQKIINLFKESPTITGKQMSEIQSVSQRIIERDLSELQKKGVLKHEGKDNGGT